ncbi:MAG: adenylate/guanylate cyclase domain-containing protein [Rhodospirillales bacterium]|nr:adenylate/guanylate cyclase domain-containing protein [Rhodospirillales bacterium]
MLPPLFLLAAAAILLADPQPLAQLRESVFDAYQRLRPRPSLPSPLRFVEIDDASLTKIGQWPWPRDRLAAVIDRLNENGARVIALDLLLVEPDRLSPQRLFSGGKPARQWAEAPTPVLDTDAALADAVARAPVVVGFAMIDDKNDVRPLRKAEMLTDPDRRVPDLRIPGFPGAIVPLPGLGEAAAGIGALNVVLAGSGVVRSVPMVLGLNGEVFPSFVAEVLRVAQRVDAITVQTGGPAAAAHVVIGALSIPTGADGQLRLYFAPPSRTLVVPAWRLITGDHDPALFRNAIVVVGAGATGLQDRHPTPLSLTLPGPLLHLQGLEQILSQTYLHRPDWAKGAELLMLLGLGGALLLVLRHSGPAVGAVIGCTATLAAVGASWLAFVEARLLFDPVLPAMAVFLVFLGTSIVRHMQIERQHRWIRSAFASYVAPSIVEELVRHPDQLALSGERRDISCLFTDLEGFTVLVEGQEPARIVPVLNDYLDGLVRIVFRFEGTIDKIIGDAVHVIFGAPIAMAGHRQRAIHCALALDAFAEDFAARQREAGLPFGRTRIGVNSGSAIVGNFGGALHFDYTAHGDMVNTAARLEGANKYLGTRILVSEATVAGCPAFRGRPAGDLLLKGKTQPVKVFEPAVATTPAVLIEAYGDAYGMMAAGDQSGAVAALARLSQRFPDDPLVAFHLHRLRRGETGTTIRLPDK